MSSKNSEFRNIILITQVGISVMVPVFLCVALGVWLDNRFDSWFTVPLLALGIAAGARNAYVLVMNVVRNEEKQRRKHLEDEIMRKVDRANHKNSYDRENKRIK